MQPIFCTLSRLIPIFLLASPIALAGETIISADSQLGRQLTLTIASAPVRRDVREAVICSNPAAQVKDVVLWMPDHNHGSSPTRVSQISDDCAKVERISFVMRGKWELRVALAHDDAAVFTLEVE